MNDLQLAFISNRRTERIFRILRMIEWNSEFTIGKLAEQNHVTQRTIASDIKFMKEYFGDSITLVSGNSGFVFNEKNHHMYQKKKKTC